MNMDANDPTSGRTAGQASSPAAARQGGTIEPSNLAALAKQVFEPAMAPAALRYEMYDPFAEVTYRTNSFEEIVAKANQLGSSRFVAVDEQGQRTVIQKANGNWQQPSASQLDRPTADRASQSPEPRNEGPASKRALHAPELQTAGEAPPTPTPAKAARASRKASTGIDLNEERAALVARIESALAERYVIRRSPVMLGPVTIGRTEYRFRGDTTRLAFTESQFRLATETNNPSVARSMVDVAQARNWKALRISGNEDFKRLVWLEANMRGVRTLGYEPTQTDRDLLQREREARLVNRIEPERALASDTAETGSTPKAKASERGAGGRKTVLAAIEAVLVAKGVPEQKREAVMVAAAEKLEQRVRAGQAPKVKVYDAAAPSQRSPVAPPNLDKQRTRDHAPPSR